LGQGQVCRDRDRGSKEDTRDSESRASVELRDNRKAMSAPAMGALVLKTTLKKTNTSQGCLKSHSEV